MHKFPLILGAIAFFSAGTASARESDSIDTCLVVASKIEQQQESAAQKASAKAIRAASDRLLDACAEQQNCRRQCRTIKRACSSAHKGRSNCRKACAKAPKAQQRPCTKTCKDGEKAYKSACGSASRSCRKKCGPARKKRSCTNGLKAMAKALGKVKSGDQAMVKRAIKACGGKSRGASSGASSGAKSRRRSNRAGKTTGKKPSTSQDPAACPKRCNKKYRSRKSRLRCITKC
jgi:hypothetical protein